MHSLEFSDPQNQVFIAALAPATGTGGGSAFTLVSPSMIDMAVVMVTHLDRPPAGAGPYTVTLTGPHRTTLSVGRLKLDSGGSAMLSRNFNRDLSGYTKVIVRDAAGRLVMGGSLTTPGRAGLAESVGHLARRLGVSSPHAIRSEPAALRVLAPWRRSPSRSKR